MVPREAQVCRVSNLGIRNQLVYANKTYLVFVKVEASRRDFVNNRQAAGLNHIAFKGVTAEDLKLLVGELGVRNVRMIFQREDAICFEDPNGFAVEVFC